MGKALPFPKHKHPPRGAGLLSNPGSAAAQTTAAIGEDQGEIAEAPTEATAEGAENTDESGAENPTL